MSGYYERAPLVYVVAAFKFNAQDLLTEHDLTAIRKSMISIGFAEYEKSEGYEVNIDDASYDASGVQLRTTDKQVVRFAYFNTKRTLCAVLSDERLEFRSSHYTIYSEFLEQLQQVVRQMSKAVPELNQVNLKELELHYNDVVVPYEGRSLNDYFGVAHACLPANSFLQDQSPLAERGKVEWVKLMDRKTKVEAQVEQLPGRVKRLLVGNMVEPDNKLAMPLRLARRPDSATKDYALVHTVASRLLNQPLGESEWKTVMGELHDYCSNTFKGMLAETVCNADWGYKERK